MNPFIFSFLILGYVVGLVWLAKKIVFTIEEKELGKLKDTQKIYEDQKKIKQELRRQRQMFLRAKEETLKLYRVIPALLSKEDFEGAFAVFKMLMRGYVRFSESLLMETLPVDLNRDPSYQGSILFTIPLSKETNRYMLWKNTVAEQREKITVLTSQLALVLRRLYLYHEIDNISILDYLTGVYSRRYMLQRFEQERRRSEERKINLSFLMLDVDHFKEINDQFGHLSGDQVLRQMGAILRASIREIDFAGRFGGEEFCVILPDTDLKGAYLAAERIRLAVERAVFRIQGDSQLKVTVSIGVATFPAHALSTTDLMDKADWALYRAKHSGRNQTCLAQEK